MISSTQHTANIYAIRKNSAENIIKSLSMSRKKPVPIRILACVPANKYVQIIRMRRVHLNGLLYL